MIEESMQRLKKNILNSGRPVLINSSRISGEEAGDGGDEDAEVGE